MPVVAAVAGGAALAAGLIGSASQSKGYNAAGRSYYGGSEDFAKKEQARMSGMGSELYGQNVAAGAVDNTKFDHFQGAADSQLNAANDFVGNEMLARARGETSAAKAMAASNADRAARGLASMAASRRGPMGNSGALGNAAVDAALQVNQQSGAMAIQEKDQAMNAYMAGRMGLAQGKAGLAGQAGQQALGTTAARLQGTAQGTNARLQSEQLGQAGHGLNAQLGEQHAQRLDQEEQYQAGRRGEEWRALGNVGSSLLGMAGGMGGGGGGGAPKGGGVSDVRAKSDVVPNATGKLYSPGEIKFDKVPQMGAQRGPQLNFMMGTPAPMQAPPAQPTQQRTLDSELLGFTDPRGDTDDQSQRFVPGQHQAFQPAPGYAEGPPEAGAAPGQYGQPDEDEAIERLLGNRFDSQYGTDEQWKQYADAEKQKRRELGKWQMFGVQDDLDKPEYLEGQQFKERAEALRTEDAGGGGGDLPESGDQLGTFKPTNIWAGTGAPGANTVSDEDKKKDKARQAARSGVLDKILSELNAPASSTKGANVQRRPPLDPNPYEKPSAFAGLNKFDEKPADHSKTDKAGNQQVRMSLNDLNRMVNDLRKKSGGGAPKTPQRLSQSNPGLQQRLVKNYYANAGYDQDFSGPPLPADAPLYQTNPSLDSRLHQGPVHGASMPPPPAMSYANQAPWAPGQAPQDDLTAMHPNAAAMGRTAGALVSDTRDKEHAVYQSGYQAGMAAARAPKAVEGFNAQDTEPVGGGQGKVASRSIMGPTAIRGEVDDMRPDPTFLPRKSNQQVQDKAPLQMGTQAPKQFGRPITPDQLPPATMPLGRHGYSGDPNKIANAIAALPDGPDKEAQKEAFSQAMAQQGAPGPGGKRLRTITWGDGKSGPKWTLSE